MLSRVAERDIYTCIICFLATRFKKNHGTWITWLREEIKHLESVALCVVVTTELGKHLEVQGIRRYGDDARTGLRGRA